MGLRGPSPKPTVLKILAGNPGRRPINPDEPQPEALDETCPEELLDPVARQEWMRRIVPAIRIGQITAADFATAIAHCNLYTTYLSLTAEASRHPHIVAVGPNKYPTMNPARLMAHKCWALLIKTEAELGFTPASRSRVQAQGPAARLQSTKSRDRFLNGTRG